MLFEETWMDLETIIQKVIKRKSHHIDGNLKKKGYICIHTADSLCYTAENNRTL